MANRLDTAFSKADDATVAINRDYGSSAGCSMEQIFSPIAINKNGNAPTPGFKPPVNLGDGLGLFAQQHVGPTNRELNPYFPIIFDNRLDDGSMFFNQCDYNAVVMDPADDISLAKNTYRAEVTGVRTKGLRGPVLISGWGFDLCDTPVPYTVRGEKRRFDMNLINDRRYWKTGPLYVMWDEERQVWAGGPQIVVGTADEDSLNGSLGNPDKFTMTIKRAGNSNDVLTEYGEKILCSNRDANLRIDRGQWVVAARLNYEWIPIHAGGGGTGMFMGRFNDVWPKGSQVSVTQITPPTDDPVNVNVYNLFADVGTSGSQSSCAYVRIDELYYLIAAECNE